ISGNEAFLDVIKIIYIFIEIEIILARNLCAGKLYFLRRSLPCKRCLAVNTQVTEKGRWQC
ncbi:hypothetical protein, partial [Lactobacillus helveticus]